ncbi:hypothetical protein EV141_1603 [Microcella putealis]|uniref:Lipoprotein n=1 Tax=Microcella putealis TaxID=337005 RepID=A0A4Q7LP26_9MICO|nr:hypothetical protein [Microcella putealis]RZS56151.1 hypothetical protein EV141_1603 [Microcella putealis]TQM23418.1 hypothetical protein BJ957_1781 [Microcella putealis]
MTTAPRILLAGVTLAAALSLSACANPLDGIVEGVVNQGVENVIEGAIEGESGGDVDVSLPGSGASLPVSWPADVPTPEGDVLFSSAVDGTWGATIVVADASVVDGIYAELEGSGWTMVSESSIDVLSSRSYENDTYTVSVSSVPDSETGAVNVTYAIASK